MKVFVISSLLVCLLAVGCDHFSPLSKGEYAFNVNGDDSFVMETFFSEFNFSYYAILLFENQSQCDLLVREIYIDFPNDLNESQHGGNSLFFKVGSEDEVEVGRGRKYGLPMKLSFQDKAEVRVKFSSRVSSRLRRLTRREGEAFANISILFDVGGQAYHEVVPVLCGNFQTNLMGRGNGTASR